MREYIKEEATIKNPEGYTIKIVRTSVKDADGNLHNTLLWMDKNYWEDPKTGDVYDYDPETGKSARIFTNCER